MDSDFCWWSSGDTFSSWWQNCLLKPGSWEVVSDWGSSQIPWPCSQVGGSSLVWKKPLTATRNTPATPSRHSESQVGVEALLRAQGNKLFLSWPGAILFLLRKPRTRARTELKITRDSPYQHFGKTGTVQFIATGHGYCCLGLGLFGGGRLLWGIRSKSHSNFSCFASKSSGREVSGLKGKGASPVWCWGFGIHLGGLFRRWLPLLL